MSVTHRLPDPREKPWLSVAELAEITGEGEKAIRSALDEGHLPLLQLGRYKRIPTAALLRLLEINEASDSTNGEVPTSPLAEIHALTKKSGEPTSCPSSPRTTSSPLGA